ncbi:hypothetical protein JMF97_17750 [Micromonospora fiedleri]|uniref:Uncharacterized protein n=1 Tax=Micromonospora fiedleri TaxID=1157498 RepID=A0ABS1UQT2_9ACTN|nr:MULTISPECIES: hypothetical protein [Micromonospora]MBL6278003.1 hypothetical protein [Micromonospora fiedleri]WSK41113.1 hypothetical protein OG712_21695 [Micromonospora maris]
MNEPVTSQTYAAQLRRLAELTARVQQQRDEAHAWYEQQCAAADRAVAESAEEVNRAERELAAARETQERVDAEVAVLWQELNARLGGGGRRAGAPPAPTPDATGDPLPLLEGARDLLRRTRQRGELPGNVNPLMLLCGLGGAVLAYALGAGARALGDRTDGELAVGLPVLALVITLLGPVLGLIPARLIADRRHATLTPRPVLLVITAGLTTTLLLLAT